MESRVEQDGLPVRMPANAPAEIITNGTTNDGEIIQAARRTP